MKKYTAVSTLSATFGFCVLLLVLGPTPAHAQGVNSVYFVINNQTGLPDDAVFVSLQGSTGALSAWGGDNSSLTADTSYSLQDLLGNLPSGVGSQTQNVPIISSTTMNGGFFDFTLGQQMGASQPASNIVNGRFEVNIQTGASSSGANAFYNTNVDVSYVNSISLPMSFSVLKRSDNNVLPLVNQLSTVNTSPTVWNSINSSTAISSANGIVAAGNYAVKNKGGTTIGYMTGNASALAPGSAGTSYHDWLTDAGGHTSLLNTLESGLITLNVSSYTVPSGAGNVLPGANWTFSKVTQGPGTDTAPYSPFNNSISGITTDTTNRFLEAQSYTMSAEFSSNLNPGGADANLTAQGITDGTAGTIISGNGGTGDGSGNTVGNFTIYITNADLNAPDGIYGSNPTYVAKWQSFVGPLQTGTTSYVKQQNSNNLVDRVVGDLTAGITFGWANALQTVADIAAAAGKEAYLVDSVFSSTYSGGGISLAGTKISELSASQYFYLLSVLGINGEADDTSGANIAAFSGSAINPTNPLLYDEYGNAFVADTDAYAYPYSDRLQGYSPDVFPMPATGDPTDANAQYIYITLSPGGYIFNAVPEPSTIAYLGAGLLLLFYKRRKTNA